VYSIGIPKSETISDLSILDKGYQTLWDLMLSWQWSPWWSSGLWHFGLVGGYQYLEEHTACIFYSEMLVPRKSPYDITTWKTTVERSRISCQTPCTHTSSTKSSRLHYWCHLRPLKGSFHTCTWYENSTGVHTGSSLLRTDELHSSIASNRLKKWRFTISAN
jgi:hypothetical protein